MDDGSCDICDRTKDDPFMRSPKEVRVEAKGHNYYCLTKIVCLECGENVLRAHSGVLPAKTQEYIEELEARLQKEDRADGSSTS